MTRTPDTLADRLRSIIAYAEAGGAPTDMLKSTAEAIVNALLELEDLRLALGSRVKALEDARRQHALADRLRGQGYTGGRLIAALRARTGASRATVYRRLKVSRR